MKLTSCLVKEYKTGNDIALLLLRVVAGLVLLYGHGFEKLTIIFSGKEIQFFDPIGVFGPTLSFYLAAFAEGICSILLILGLFTRFALVFLVINFIVIFTFHAFIAGDGFGVLELRFFYLASFIALLLLGPGRISLDHMLFGKK
ncbi:MAG: DoxX family protein [Chitinophagaceae bacterium]|nr:DoxX family protein [Chitinophagaceae bacterium]